MERTLLKLSDIAEVFGELKRVAEGGKLVGITYEEMKKFDLDLEFGKIGEDFVQDMQNGNTMIEVKTERDIWKNTGNNKIEGGFIFSVDDLKDKIRRLLKEEKARLVMGGDFDSSQMALLPIKELF
jgi:hypothetical protein